jgi:hypothetical protein
MKRHKINNIFTCLFFGDAKMSMEMKVRGFSSCFGCLAWKFPRFDREMGRGGLSSMFFMAAGF